MNWLSLPGVVRPASTSCAPTQRMTTTLANTRKMMIAVSTARARVDCRAAWNARSTAAPNRDCASRSLVKACSVRIAPISSAA